MVLLDDLLVLLQVNDNGKFILKNHNITMMGSTGDNKVRTYSASENKYFALRIVLVV